LLNVLLSVDYIISQEKRNKKQGFYPYFLPLFFRISLESYAAEKFDDAGHGCGVGIILIVEQDVVEIWSVDSVRGIERGLVLDIWLVVVNTIGGTGIKRNTSTSLSSTRINVAAITPGTCCA